jgi:hypothetical protein
VFSPFHLLLVWYDPFTVQRLFIGNYNSFLIGISPLLFGVQQPPVSQSGATTSNHGLRVPHLSKRRRDRGQRFGISERSFERHKVGSFSQIVRVLLGISAREQAGVTTDLAQDPTLVRRLFCSFPYICSFLDPRHTPTSLAQNAVMRSTPFDLLGWSTLTLCSCRRLARCSTKINRSEKRLV